jgi:predicted transcriptional regulator
MADAIHQQLERDLVCNDLLECIYELTDLDRECFRVLSESDEPMTVDELATHVDRERSTAYRSVQRLLKVGLVQKEQENYEHGGYYHVYRVTDPDEIAAQMQERLNQWYSTMDTLIREFREEYTEVRAQS